eukprot:251271-Pyramimonas_sp.AAC.1
MDRYPVRPAAADGVKAKSASAAESDGSATARCGSNEGSLSSCRWAFSKAVTLSYFHSPQD